MEELREALTQRLGAAKRQIEDDAVQIMRLTTDLDVARGLLEVERWEGGICYLAGGGGSNECVVLVPQCVMNMILAVIGPQSVAHPLK